VALSSTFSLFREQANFQPAAINLQELDAVTCVGKSEPWSREPPPLKFVDLVKEELPHQVSLWYKTSCLGTSRCCIIPGKCGYILIQTTRRNWHPQILHPQISRFRLSHLAFLVSSEDVSKRSPLSNECLFSLLFFALLIF